VTAAKVEQDNEWAAVGQAKKIAVKILHFVP
jgi:hypothetical protein